MIFSTLRRRRYLKSLHDSFERSDWDAFKAVYFSSVDELSSDILLLYAKRFCEVGNLVFAQEILEKITLRSDDKVGDAFGVLGQLFLQIRNWAGARQAFENAIKNGVAGQVVWVGLGRALIKLRLFEEARRAVSKVNLVGEIGSDALFLIGEARKAEGELELAVSALKDALRLNGGNTEAAKSLALQYAEQEAWSEFNQHISNYRVGENEFEHQFTIANICTSNCEYIVAEKAFKLALKEEPNSVICWSHYGISCRESGRVDKALTLLQHALSIDPAHPLALWHMSLCHLLKGRFDIGWKNYGLRRLSEYGGGFRQFDIALWTGEEKANKLLIYGEQGIGDEIMFASCIHLILDRVNSCVLECNAKLERLFTESFNNCSVIGTQQSTNLLALPQCKNVDYAVPIGDLPRIVLNNSGWIQSLPPYLKVDDATRVKWRNKLGSLAGKKKVGISWRGGLAITRSKLRSIKLEDLLPIFNVEDISFVSLQYGDVEEDLRRLSSLGIKVTNWPEAHEDYYQTAALVGELDLVISVQTAVVHLGGALGKDVWALISAGPEWRYGESQEVMPWYRHVKLFRQKTLKDWSPVIGEVVEELKIFVND